MAWSKALRRFLNLFMSRYAPSILFLSRINAIELVFWCILRNSWNMWYFLRWCTIIYISLVLRYPSLVFWTRSLKAVSLRCISLSSAFSFMTYRLSITHRLLFISKPRWIFGKSSILMRMTFATLVSISFILFVIVVKWLSTFLSISRKMLNMNSLPIKYLPASLPLNPISLVVLSLLLPPRELIKL